MVLLNVNICGAVDSGNSVIGREVVTTQIKEKPQIETCLSRKPGMSRPNYRYQKSGGAKKSPDACQTRWGTLKAQYQLVKMLRNKSGWGWNDEDKHVVVDDATWNAYEAINGKVRGWRFKSFPLYDEMAQLVDGAVATGEGAFNPGQAVASAPSPDWPEDLLEEDKDDDFPLDPVLKGPAGRVCPLPRAPETPGPFLITTLSDDNSEDDLAMQDACAQRHHWSGVYQRFQSATVDLVR